MHNAYLFISFSVEADADMISCCLLTCCCDAFSLAWGCVPSKLTFVLGTLLRFVNENKFDISRKGSKRRREATQ
jgi:hypothetical protein